MNPIAKKLLYSTLGGAAPGALVGAAVSEEDNRLRNALIGAGLGGAAGAGIYSAKRLGDVKDLNKVYDDLLSDRPVASTMDDLKDFRAGLMTRGFANGHIKVTLSGPEAKRNSVFGGNPNPNSTYKLVDASSGRILKGHRDLPFTETYVLRAKNPGQKGNVFYQYDPDSKRTFFYVGDATGRRDHAGTLITESLDFSVPGEASELAKNLDKDFLDKLMASYSTENFRESPRMTSEQIEKLFGGAPGSSQNVRQTVDLNPKFNEGSRGSFFQDFSMPSYDVGYIYSKAITDNSNTVDPASLIELKGRLEKRSSLKLRGKSRLRQALINAASASR